MTAKRRLIILEVSITTFNPKNIVPCKNCFTKVHNEILGSIQVTSSGDVNLSEFTAKSGVQSHANTVTNLLCGVVVNFYLGERMQGKIITLTLYR